MNLSYNRINLVRINQFSYPMTRYWSLSLILLVSTLCGCFPTIEQKNPVLLDVGKTELGYYRNQYFGYSMRIPDAWHFHDAKSLYPDDERYTVENITVVDTVSPKAQLIKLGAIVKEGNLVANMHMQANYVGDFTIPEEAGLSQQIFASYKDDFPGFALKTSSRKPINGRFYHIWEGSVQQDDHVFLRDFYLLLTKDKTYGLSFILTYQDEEDKQVLSDLITNVFWRIRD